MNHREAAAAAKKQLRFGYFDQRGSGGTVYIVCPAPCREKVSIDRFTRKAELESSLVSALALHMEEEH